MKVLNVNSNLNCKKVNSRPTFIGKADNELLVRYVKIPELKKCLINLKNGNKDALNIYFNNLFDELAYNLSKRMSNAQKQLNEDGTKMLSYPVSKNEKISFTLGDNKISSRNEKLIGHFSEITYSLNPINNRIQRTESFGFKDKIAQSKTKELTEHINYFM